MKADVLSRLGLVSAAPVASRPVLRVDPCSSTAVEPRERVEIGGFLPPLPPRMSIAPAPDGRSPASTLVEVLAPHTTRHIMQATLHEPVDPSREFLVGGADTERLDPHLKKHFPGLGVLSSLCLACTVLGAVLPGAAYAQEPAGVSTSTAISPAARALEDPTAASTDAGMAALARSYGLNPAVMARVAQDGQTAHVLQVLPENLRTMYRNLKPAHKQMMVKKLEGTSGFLFIRISNRQAFIDGQAAGHNTFDEMQKMLKDMHDEGKIDTAMFANLHGAVEQFRTMSPQQRAALVTLLEADVGYHS